MSPTPLPLAPMLAGSGGINITSRGSVSLTLRVSLSKPGLLYCAAFRPPRASARTGSEIKAAAYAVNVTSTASAALVSITGLVPLTPYQVLCYT